jgi:hypothetical protein
MRGSADITGRGGTALTTKMKRGEEIDTGQGDMTRKTISGVRDTDRDELKTVTVKTTSTAHGELQMIKIGQMVARGQNAMLHQRTNTIDDGMTADTGGRKKAETTVKRATVRERIIALVVIEEQGDEEGSIMTHCRLLTTGSFRTYASAQPTR